jgi:hypothetical protein
MIGGQTRGPRWGLRSLVVAPAGACLPDMDKG